MAALPDEVTELLIKWSNGDEAALDELIPLVHTGLRRLAKRYMGREREDHTLQTSALINEAYLRLIDQQSIEWKDRAHFFAVSAQIMRHVLIDHARKHHSDKRGAGARKLPIDDAALRERVDSLLSSDEQGWDLLEKPAFEAAADLLAEDQPELSEGEQIGHYKVVSLLGVGGMGHVYLAEDAKLGRKVALKLLPTSYTRDGSRLRRFQQEARSASALNHPNILTIHELGEVGGRQFIATEFVEGETLREHLRRGPLNLPETLDIAIQIAGALAAAHKAGIVHRDIKPENIMLRHDGYIKVLDFGLAKLTEQHEPTSEAHAAKNVNVSSGLVMGTVKYMSPEQAQGLPVDPRSDIFSLGVVLYEMLAGHAPFHGESNSDLILSILTRDPAPIAEFVPNAAIEIQAVVNKALRKSVDRRYQSSSEMIEDLKAIARSLTLVTETTNSAYPPYAQIAQQANGPAPSSGQRISEEEKPSEKVLGLEYRLQRPGRLELRSGATLIANDGLTPVRSEGQSAPPKEPTYGRAQSPKPSSQRFD